MVERAHRCLILSVFASPFSCALYLVNKQLQDEGGDAAVDSDEEVDGGEDYIGCAWDAEQKGRWVHQRGDGPPERDDEFIQYTVIIFVTD